jgi:hypothetical protein
MHAGAASDGAHNVAAAADADLDALLLSGPDALLLDFWAEGAPAGALRGSEAEGGSSGLDAPLQPMLPLRCLDTSHAPGCARCAAAAAVRRARRVLTRRAVQV